MRHPRITGMRALELLQALESWLGEHTAMGAQQGLKSKHVIYATRDALKDHVMADLQRAHKRKAGTHE